MASGKARGEAVLDWIDGAAKAARQARRDPSDEAALHRFRVNARRLIVYSKACGSACGVPGKLRKRLRRALRATGPRRDGHVASLWMENYLRRHRDERDRGLRRALLNRRESAPGGRRWWRKVDETLARLRGAINDGAAKPRTLRAAQNEASREAWARLARDLRRLEADAGRKTLHKARISVKRLRYLLEAMGRPPRGLPSPAALRALQTALGEAHDRDVIAAGIAAAGGAPKAPARRALAQLERERKARIACARYFWRPLLHAQRSKAPGARIRIRARAGPEPRRPALAPYAARVVPRGEPAPRP